MPTDPPARAAPTATNWKVAGGFLGLLLTTIAVAIAWDVWLVRTHPPGSSISWSMSTIGYGYPIFTFTLGFVVGAVIFGLAAHFWAGMDTPDDRAELIRLRAEVKRLNGLLVAERFISTPA